MNKIPKCNTKKMAPLKINKKTNKESVCGKMKMKILSNKSIMRNFGQDITNLSKNKDNKDTIRITKKSSSYNDKVSKKYIFNFHFNRKLKILR